MTGGVRTFFERYAAAFEAYDAAAIAACFATPCLFVRAGQTEAAADEAAVTASVEALLDLHRGWDVGRADPAEVAVLEEGPGHAIARVGWRLGRPGTRVEWAFATTYALVPPPADGAAD